MKVSSSLVAAVTITVSSAVTVFSRDTSNGLTESQQLADLLKSAQSAVVDQVTAEEKKLRKCGVTPTCGADKLVFRREYGSISKAERLAYVNAVKCLMTKPPKTPAYVAPGAKSRFDDFVVTHIQQTLSIHFNGIFQPWHRWFVYQYELALRNECGYKGYEPYWDWPKYASAPQDSPLFNSDPYSLSGNGEFIPHEGPVIVPPPGGDLFTSPGDPAFWAHHGMMDRMWATWQVLGELGSGPNTRLTDLGSSTVNS